MVAVGCAVIATQQFVVWLAGLYRICRFVMWPGNCGCLLTIGQPTNVPCFLSLAVIQMAGERCYFLQLSPGAAQPAHA